MPTATYKSNSILLKSNCPDFLEKHFDYLLPPEDILEVYFVQNIIKIESTYESKEQDDLVQNIFKQKPDKIFFIYPNKIMLEVLENLFYLYNGQLPSLVFLVNESFYYQVPLWGKIVGCLKYQETLFLAPHPHLKFCLEKFLFPSENLCAVLPWALKKNIPLIKSNGLKEQNLVFHTWGAMHEGQDWKRIENKIQEYPQCTLNILGPYEIPRLQDIGETQLFGLSYFKLDNFLKKNPQVKYIGELSEDKFLNELSRSSLYIDYSCYPFPHPPWAIFSYLLNIPCEISPWGYHLFFNLEKNQEERLFDFSLDKIVNDLHHILKNESRRFETFTDLFWRLSHQSHNAPTRPWCDIKENWNYSTLLKEFYPSLETLCIH